MSSRTASEHLFETYLTEHRYQFAHEPDLGIAKRPDYLISRTGIEAVCEVKQFETTVMRGRLAVCGPGGRDADVEGGLRRCPQSARRGCAPTQAARRRPAAARGSAEQPARR